MTFADAHKSRRNEGTVEFASRRDMEVGELNVLCCVLSFEGYGCCQVQDVCDFLWFCFCEFAFSSVSMLCCFILVTIIMHFNVFQLCLGQAAIEKLDDTELNGRRIKLVPEKG